MSPTVETIGNVLLAISAWALVITLCTVTLPIDPAPPVKKFSRKPGDTRTDEEILRARYQAKHGEDGYERLEAVRRRGRQPRAARDRRAAEARAEDMVAQTANVRRESRLACVDRLMSTYQSGTIPLDGERGDEFGSGQDEE
ncbi:unnamed protein product [Zymoseptoria tritici ST99CH_1E4]|uniref:Uncharacterized protein n=2 Tax=Zymoseptoria tritici TaxID=1047171 RepID=F9XEW7_ZYMTI|nr:uncharacterized protein MYCGRDRAFT_94750 [Zymoseptoria tritici IPO323]EGP85845.1 hypothetical protein MYCGRDRAFT_94750 [Zymoseptoria tritici IPO323]SMR55676.1 unnamed protein product [Zymoseptoria tritici ST99CH_1E4]